MVTAEFGANQLAGPALGAFLFTAAVGIPFMLSSGLVFVASLLVAGLPRTQSAPSGKTNESSRRPFTSLRRDISEGARFVFRCTWLRNALGLGALLTVTDSAWFSVLVLFARGEIGLGASGYGLMLTLGAAGGIIGGSLSDRIIIRTGLAGALRGSVAVAGVAELCLGFAGSIPGAVLALAVGNAAIAVWHTASASLRQSATPPHLLGRVNAVWRTAFMGVIPLGAMTGGFMAARFGLRAPFLTGGPALLVAALLVRRVTDSSKPAPRKKGA
jgi:MFS family permease